MTRLLRRFSRSLLPTTLLWLQLLPGHPAAAQDAAADSGRPADVVQADFRKGAAAMQAGRVEEGIAVLRQLVESGEYKALSVPQQSRVLPLVAWQFAQSDPGKAYDFFKQAIAYPEPDVMALDGHGQLAAKFGDTAESIDSLLKLYAVATQYWNEHHDEIMALQIRNALREANPETEYELLNRLYSAGIKSHTGVEPSGLWLRFVELLLASGEDGRAAAVAGRISSPVMLARMRIDTRFDPIVVVNPALLDVERAAAAQIENSLLAAERYPRSLAQRTALLQSLYEARQYARVLQYADEVTATAAAGTASGIASPAFSDLDEMNWVLDYKARALVMLQRYDEAVEAWIVAAELPERTGLNVSQKINLAALYTDLGHYDKALELLGAVGPASAYGKIQIEVVRLRSALEQADAESTARSYEFIRQNRTVSPIDYLESSLLVGREQDAADYLIEMLDDESLRGAALSRLQRYADMDQRLPAIVSLDNAVQRLGERNEVAAAISKWGRIEEIPLPWPLR